MAPKIVAIGIICELFSIDLAGEAKPRDGDGLDFYTILKRVKMYALRGGASR